MECFIPSSVAQSLEFLITYVRCHDAIYNKLTKPTQFSGRGADDLAEFHVLLAHEQIPGEVK
jgi:hypothetical protein